VVLKVSLVCRFDLDSCHPSTPFVCGTEEEDSMSGPGGSSNRSSCSSSLNADDDGAFVEEATPVPPLNVDPSFRCSCRAAVQSEDVADVNDDPAEADGNGKGATGVVEGESVTSAPSPNISPRASNAPLGQSNRLCDRERESEQLRSVFDRCCCSLALDSSSSDAAKWLPSTPYRGELALVTGPSGCGKTCLVEKVFREALRRRRENRSLKAPEAGVSATGGEPDDGKCDSGCSSSSCDDDDDDDLNLRGLMISGKFDQLERREQYYAIVQALTEYALILSRESSPSQLRSVRSALAPHTETVRIVAELVPELQTLLDFDDDESEVNANQQDSNDDTDRANRISSQISRSTNRAPEGGTLARERLQLGLCRFFSSICSPQNPIVLFLDDLQWAEPASLDLLASLFIDRIPGLVLVGACRDNEVDPASYLCVILRELEARHVVITQVIVSNVKQPALVSALGDSFGVGTDKASVAARILFEHTAGNMFFVTQLVRYLVNEGILYKGKDSPLWTFESELRIREAIRAATDEVSLLAIVIRKQEREVQDTLMVASCLGAEFSELALRTAVAFDVEESLQVAQRMSLLKRSSHDRQMWRFVHDRIQESAYSLIPPHEREQVHLRIGRKLWSSLSASELDVYTHVVVKQLRLGVRLINDPAERELLSILLLRAGELAAKSSAHVTAQEYVSLGIELLETRHWRDQYSLSLALYNAAAEIEYCLANFERMDGLVEVIMENTRGTKDKIRARTAQIYSLGSRNMLNEAIEVGLETLNNFVGEVIPSRPSAYSIIVELRKTRHLLRQHSDASLMSLPAMDDFQTLSSIRIMCLLLMYAVLGRPTLTPILAMRIVQHSLRHGLCGMSGTGFAFYGMVLTLFFNDVETGIRYGSIALKIVERFDAMEQLARVSTVAYCFCLSYTEPLPSLLQPLRLAHRVGMGSGDIEHSLMAAGMYAMVAVHTSHPLSSLSTELSTFLALTAAYRHSSTDLLFRPLAQFVQCLRGEAADPSKLTGTYVDWEEALDLAMESNHSAAASMILSCKLMLECMFRKVDDAEATLHMLTRPGSRLETAPCFMKAAVWLHRGLSCAALAHRDGFIIRRKIREARLCHRRLLVLRRYSESNYGGKALLLGAEIMSARGSHHQALLEYGAAVTACRTSAAWGDAGLACERLSSALMAKGRSDESLIYLNQASRYYEMWGATAKVAELRSAILRKRDIGACRQYQALA
jgi:predicted ATPase